MARFVFTLQALLLLRQQTEREAERVLAEALRDRAQADTALQQAELLYARIRHDARIPPGGELSVTVQENALHYLDAALRGIRFAQARCDQAKQRCAAARADLLAAAARRQALERLRDRQEDEFRRAQARSEERALDDVIGARYRMPPARPSLSGEHNIVQEVHHEYGAL